MPINDHEDDARDFWWQCGQIRLGISQWHIDLHWCLNKNRRYVLFVLEQRSEHYCILNTLNIVLELTGRLNIWAIHSTASKPKQRVKTRNNIGKFQRFIGMAEYSRHLLHQKLCTCSSAFHQIAQGKLNSVRDSKRTWSYLERSY